MKILLNDIKGQGKPPPKEPGATAGPLPGPPQPSVLETAANVAKKAMGTLGSMFPGPVREPSFQQPRGRSVSQGVPPPPIATRTPSRGRASASSSGVPPPVQQQVVMSSGCLLYTSPSPRDLSTSRMPSSA